MQPGETGGWHLCSCQSLDPRQFRAKQPNRRDRHVSLSHSNRRQTLPSIVDAYAKEGDVGDDGIDGIDGIDGRKQHPQVTRPYEPHHITATVNGAPLRTEIASSVD